MVKIGDKVKVNGTLAFNGKQGHIRGRETLPSNYDWAVVIDGMSTDSEDTYGFNESELEVIE